MASEISEHVKQHFNEFYEANPFLELLGVRVASYERGRVSLEMDVKHEHTNVHHIAHGGVAATMVDTAMGIACFTCDKGVVTLGMNMSFIRPVCEGRISAVGEVIHAGKHTMVCEGRVFDENGTLCLKSDGTFFVVRDFTTNPEG
ncbi:MAG: PaaI family thioesterase [Schwartzia succinivorans]|jgi:acyl-CoA thioesterase|nr:PaaI family thioesterase [Schwartzia succinivorans]